MPTDDNKEKWEVCVLRRCWNQYDYSATSGTVLHELHFLGRHKNSCMGEMSHANVAPTLRSDPRLFSDDIDIKFSRTLNSYKLPQIRHASIERLAERLIDLRFLSIDFLTTLLLTYRVFTTSQTILDAVKHVYYHAYSECCCSCAASSGRTAPQQPPAREPSQGDEVEEQSSSSSSSPPRFLSRVEFAQVAPQDLAGVAKPQPERVVKPRAERVAPDIAIISKETSDCQGNALSARLKDVPGNGSGFRKYEKPEPTDDIESDCSSAASLVPLLSLVPPKTKLAPIASCETLSESLDLIPGGSDESCPGSSGPGSPVGDFTITSTRTLPTDSAFSSMSSVRTPAHLSPRVAARGAAAHVRTPTPQRLQVPLCLLTDTSSLKSEPDTVLCSTRTTAPLTTPLLTSGIIIPSSLRSIPTSPQSSPKKMTAFNTFRRSFMSRKTSAPSGILDNNQLDALALSPTTSPKVRRATSPNALSYCPLSSSSTICTSDGMMLSSPARSPVTSPKRSRARTTTRSINSPSSSSSNSSIVHMSPSTKSRSGKGGSPEQSVTCSATGANSGRHCIPQVQNISCSSSSTKVCNKNTSCRHRQDTTPDSACSATAKTGSFISKDGCKAASLHRRAGPCDVVSHITRSHAATVRVLTLLQHWIQRHLQDFVEDHLLRSEVELILDDIITNCNVTSSEHKTALGLSKILAKNIDIFRPKVDLELLLAPSQVSPKQSFNTLSPMEIAEQMTYLDHQIFKAIRSEELLNQSWMKPDKAVKAPHVLLVSKRFNEASRLVVNQIVCRQTVQERAACIEKWTVVADICCCMHNYNGVLQICAAFVNSAVYRLKKTWEKISKQTRQTVDRLQTLVSSDGRFKNMRDALHRCDPPCIPYLGMYLTDLSFIEEGTSNITEDGLINFSKMRMITQVIGEIRHFQQVSYQIDHTPRVTCYLLDTSKLLEEEETYNFSLEMEPRAPRLSVPGQFSA